MSSSQCIPAEGDIAGPGVLFSTYAQSGLGLIPVVSALLDKKVESYELQAIKNQLLIILLMAFSLEIAAIVQASTFGLSGFHASIILSLGWITNTHTSIFFLLYIHHNLSWGRRGLSVRWKNKRRRVTSGSAGVVHINTVTSSTMQHRQKSLLSAIFGVHIQGTALLLGSLHFTMMSVLGIWLWSNPLSFGTAAPANACTTQYAFASVLGKYIPMGSRSLRIFWLCIYVLFLVPGLNLLPPVTFFLGIFLICRSCCRRRSSPLATSSVDFPLLLPTGIGIFLLLFFNAMFIANIELTLKRNQHLVTAGESRWTFGQILAMLLLILPLHDLQVFKTCKKDGALENALRKDAEWKTLWDLVEKGADINIKAEDCASRTVLGLMVSRRDADSAKLLLARGADPNIGAPLLTACAQGDLEMVGLLLQYGANVNIKGGHYGSPLQTAVWRGKPEIVSLLLKNGANINEQGGHYGSAIHAAACHGDREIAQILLQRGANINFQDSRGVLPVETVIHTGNLQMVRFLLERGARITDRVLDEAIREGKEDIIKLLRDHSATEQQTT